MRVPVVALVGRPNVGKSTIFNRLVGKKIAIIEDTPGVTRDRIYGRVKYNNYNFHLIDTGGIDLGNEDFNKEIRVQAELAIDEADVIVFIVDGKEDLGPNDYLIKDTEDTIMNSSIKRFLEELFSDLAKDGEKVLNKKNLLKLYLKHTKNESSY